MTEFRLLREGSRSSRTRHATLWIAPGGTLLRLTREPSGQTEIYSVIGDDRLSTGIPGWTREDLTALIVTAGEIAMTYGTGTDGLDRDGVLSARQRDVLGKAARDYRNETR